MQVNNIAAPTFQAHIPRRVKQALSNEAMAKGGNAYGEYVTKSKLIESWGNETSSLSLVDKFEDKAKKGYLILVDSYLAPFRQ